MPALAVIDPPARFSPPKRRKPWPTGKQLHVLRHLPAPKKTYRRAGRPE